MMFFTSFLVAISGCQNVTVQNARFANMKRSFRPKTSKTSGQTVFSPRRRAHLQEWRSRLGEMLTVGFKTVIQLKRLSRLDGMLHFRTFWGLLGPAGAFWCLLEALVGLPGAS
jgi:hypothetical protein